MREQEMRLRVFSFLKARMRSMIMPATVGIGLVVGGSCTRTESTPVYSAPTYHDAAAAKDDVGGAPVYSAPMDGPITIGDGPGAKKDALLAGDVGSDLPQPGGDAQATPDVGPDLAPDLLALDGGAVDDAGTRDTLATEAGDATQILDGRSDLGGMKYIAPFLDAGPADSSSDIGGTVTKYMASTPDAGTDSNPATRYLAQMPDAATDLNVGILYLAQLPKGA
jgi:hypothetical protein